MNKRRQKKYEKNLGYSVRPKRWPYLIRSKCCGKIIARYAMRQKLNCYNRLYHFMAPSHWLIDESYETYQKCPDCGVPRMWND